MHAPAPTSTPTPESQGRPRPHEDLPAPAIAPEGRIIVVMFVVGTLLLAGAGFAIGRLLISPLAGWIGLGVAGGAGALLTAWCVWFFRDPRRELPADPDVLISPADGVISYAGPGVPPAELGLSPAVTAGMTRVSVFMNVFNVHVNRAPVEGVVKATQYRAGKFFNASFDKASEHNERMSLVIRTSEGLEIPCVQIAGLIARRIVCRVSVGARLRRGQRFGLIRFGSRVDVYLPAGIAPMVKVGDRSVAGETIFAKLPRMGIEHDCDGRAGAHQRLGIARGGKGDAR